MQRRPVFHLWWTLAAVVCLGLDVISGFRERDICQGTSNGLTFNDGLASSRLRMLRERYSDCTYVDGNLEIVGLDDETIHDADLTFLNSIREVTGYVLVASVYVRYLPLESLIIIRGDTLFVSGEKHSGDAATNSSQKDNKYALYVSVNYKVGTTIGLQQLGLHNLSEISNGNVLFENNNYLCYAATLVNWEDIFANPRQQTVHLYQDNGHSVTTCSPCNERCNYGRNGVHCWGPGEQHCQKLNKVVCADQCDGRCFGTAPNACCHQECAAGCNNATKRDCWGCKHFYNDGRCEQQCPPLLIYDSVNFNIIPNPERKFAFGTLCVDSCPKNFLEHRGGCVRSCPDGYESVNRSCVECTGFCPKSCKIKWPSETDFLNAKNIDSLVGCTIIDGHLRIFDVTFSGDEHFNTPSLELSQLSVLQSVKEITGYLNIDGVSAMSNLSFFSNLEVIHGRELDGYGAALRISHNADLESLGLTSLKSIAAGNMLINDNPRLCYMENIKWDRILPSAAKVHEMNNQNSSECARQGRVCQTQCKNGCWGPGDRSCIDCRNYYYEGRCVPDCNLPLVYAQSLPPIAAGQKKSQAKKMCAPCHRECADSCTGPGADQCMKCKHFKDGPYCVDKCPDIKYPDGSQKECKSCHDNCLLNCSGPLNTIGEGGCHLCELAVANDAGTGISHCLPKNTSECPPGYYSNSRPPPPLDFLRGHKVCLKCNSLCETCDGPGVTACMTCKHYSYEGRCTDRCPSQSYADNVTHTCNRCHEECHKQCSGPTEWHCIGVCKNYKVKAVWSPAEDGNTTATKPPLPSVAPGTDLFYCAKECPATMPHVQKEDSNDVCVENVTGIAAPLTPYAAEMHKGPIIGGSVAGGVIVIGLGVLIAFLCRQRALSQENTLRLTMKLTGLEGEEEPLTPTNVKPNLSKLRLIRESELRKGGIIGSGAFGTVYKGVWIPEGENVKIPVAIKVLQEGTTPDKNKELLEEAHVMASVEHTCCVRILAVCMTVQMMLITQLMPLGCLLDYVRKHKENIGSKVLLNWCTQIAKGMAYLEESGIVHRDLAARNVLVQSANQVKITDFGLAKLLDFNEDQYHAAGGKMPIKWLALESIQHRIFTHMTDVWSFGVTLWELFTYGQRPYENVRARDVPELLEKGERLPQPSICTIDVYMIMIKCWMLNAESRPKFTELANEFAKMSRDPGRYLVIQGDTHLRLPSGSYDAREIVRNLSVTGGDGPEEILEAEEYLQPAESDPACAEDVGEDESPEDETDSASVSDTNVFGQAQASAAELEEPSATLLREKKYANLEIHASADKRRGNSLSSRYSSEPCKALQEGASCSGGPNEGEDSADSPFLCSTAAAGTGRSRPKMAPLELQSSRARAVPIDEDDYLQPRSQYSSAYVDLLERGPPNERLQTSERAALVSGRSDKESLKASSLSGRQRSLASPKALPETQAIVQNPEYFDGSFGTDSEELGGGAGAGCSSDRLEYYNELSGTVAAPGEQQLEKKQQPPPPLCETAE